MMLVDQLRWSFRNIHIEESAVISFVSVSVIYSVVDPNPDPPDPHASWNQIDKSEVWIRFRLFI